MERVSLLVDFRCVGGGVRGVGMRDACHVQKS